MPRATLATRTFVILAAAAAGMAALLALLPAAGHDQMWLLYAARLMLGGAPLYGTTIFETNPPLIVWLSAIPEWLAGLTGMPDTALGKLLMVLLEAGVAALCLHLLGKLRRLSGSMLAALLFAWIVVVAVLPARDFGQRDHLLALLILPYLFAAAVRLAGLPIVRPLAVMVGVLGLLGLVLKPHQILIPLAVEALLLSSRGGSRLRRLFRPELLAMSVSGLVFLGAVRRFAPLYFSSIVPIERDTYWAYGQRSLTQLLTDSLQLHGLLLICCALFLVQYRRGAPGEPSALSRILLAAGLASTLAFYLQGTGWYYHQLPALTTLSLLFVSLLMDQFASHPVSLPGWTAKAAAALSILALALTTHFMGYPFTEERSFPLDQPDARLFAGLAPGAAVLTLSPTVDDTIQPLFKFHLTLGQRYPALLMLPALLRSEAADGTPLPSSRHRLTPQRIAELDRLQHQFMVEDLNRWQPALVLVQQCQLPEVHCQVLGDRHDDLLAFFLRDPAFRRAFSPYHRTQTLGPYVAYARNK